MHVLLPILLVMAALGTVVTVQRARFGRLRRLQHLVEAKNEVQTVQAAEGPSIAERLLPRGLVRSLHLLGIEPGLREFVIAAAVAGLPFAVVAAGFGLIPALALAGPSCCWGRRWC